MHSFEQSGATAPLSLTHADLDALEERLARRFAELIDNRRENDLPRLLNQREVAGCLGVSERTIDTLVATGDLTPIRITPGKRSRRFDPAAIEAYIRRCAVRR